MKTKSKPVKKKVIKKIIDVLQYEKALPKKYLAIGKKLRSEINAALPKTASKVWHGHPVWFVKESPVVGYSTTAKNGIGLLFWNGQAFKEPLLVPVGKFKAAQLLFQDVKEIDAKLLRKLLKQAGTNIWDYRGSSLSLPAKARFKKP